MVREKGRKMKKNPSPMEKRYITTLLILTGIVTVINIVALGVSLASEGEIVTKFGDMLLYAIPIFLMLTSFVIPSCRDKSQRKLLTELKKEYKWEESILDEKRKMEKIIEEFSDASLKKCSLKDKLFVIKTELLMSMEGKGDYRITILETCLVGLVSIYAADAVDGKSILIVSYAIIWILLLFSAEKEKEEKAQEVFLLKVIEEMEKYNEE